MQILNSIKQQKNEMQVVKIKKKTPKKHYVKKILKTMKKLNKT